MNQTILHISQVVLSWGGAHVALRVEVRLHVAIYASSQSKKSDVELSPLVQEWSLTILLDDVGALLPIDHWIWDNLLNLGEFSAHSDSTTSIRILARFDNP